MLMVLGAGHHEVGLARLEDLAASEASLRKVLGDAIAEEDAAIRGAVVLSTCNRLEIYLEAARFHDAVDTVSDALTRASEMDPDEAEDALRVRVGSAVGAHLFAVAAGLDAMVVGEAEIAGQVSKAHTTAQQDGTVTPALHSLFRRASRTAKSVASQTRLGDEGRSVAGVALDIATERLGGDLHEKSALIVGTGAYARVLATALRARGCVDLQVFSASGRATAFSRTHQAAPVSADGLPAVLASVDLVVSASGRGTSVPVSDEVRKALTARERPLVAVDLALMHDVPDEIRELPAVEVIDLHTVADAVGPAHGSELRAAQRIVLDAVSAFDAELAERALDPAVVALRSHVFASMESEVERLRRKYDGEVADDVTKALHRVTNSLLHTPTMRAKELAKDGSGEDYVKALHTLFGISLPEPDAAGHTGGVGTGPAGP